LRAAGTGAEVLIQDGITGYLFKNNDVDDLAEKMMNLIDNKELHEFIFHLKQNIARPLSITKQYKSPCNRIFLKGAFVYCYFFLDDFRNVDKN
jgi:glycosyltransferase involved in cell wall biosynthesis